MGPQVPAPVGRVKGHEGQIAAWHEVGGGGLVLFKLLNLGMAAVRYKGKTHQVVGATIDAEAGLMVAIAPAIPQITHRNGFLKKGQAKDVLDRGIVGSGQLLDVISHCAYGLS